MIRLRVSLLAALVSVSFSSTTLLSAAEPSGIIYDANWTIEIRPSNRPFVSQSVPALSATASNSPQNSQANGPQIGPQIEPQPAPGRDLPVAPAPEGATSTPPESREANGARPVAPPEAQAQRPLIGPPEMTSMNASGLTYQEAYATVPFSRTEYEANPGYRHQAALEILFGALRPLTMVQHVTPRASRYPDTYQYPYSRSDTQHINVRYFGRSPFDGQSPFGYPYGLRGNW